MEETENATPEILLLSAELRIETKTKQRRIYKNVLTICFTFMLTFLAFITLITLQSSLNTEKGIGITSLCVIHAGVVTSSLLFSPLVISVLGCKWTIASCILCYSGFAAANIYPTWYTMMPASVILGMAAGPLWSAKATYLTSSAIEYASLTKRPADQIISLFFGIFFGFFVSGQLIGNVIMSFVLKPEQKGVNSNETSSRNVSLTCGAEECPFSQQALQLFFATKEPSPESVLVLMITVLLLIVISAFPVILFVDKIKVYGSEERADDSIKSKILAPLKQFKDIRMILFSPLFIFQGMFGGFIYTEFTKAYLACTYGVSKLGLIMISYALARALVSSLIGKIAVYAGRRVLIPLAGVLSLTILVVLRMWIPDADSQLVTHFVAVSFGISLALWNTQLSAFLGTIFCKNQEAAFSNLRVCDSLGMMITFAYGNFLCVYVKLYILISWLIFSMVLYFIAEYVNSRKFQTESEGEAAEAINASNKSK